MPGSRRDFPDGFDLQDHLLDNINHFILALAEDGTIVYVNSAARRSLGYGWEELVGRVGALESLHEPAEIRRRARELSEELGERVVPGFETFVARARRNLPEVREWTYVRKDGSRFQALLTVSPLRRGDGSRMGYVAVASDVAEHRHLVQELRIAATAFESQVAIMITDHQLHILRVNPAFTRMTGYTAREAVGKTPAILKSGRQDRGFYERMWADLKATGHWQGEIWNRRKSGEIYPEWLTITAVRDGEGELTHYVSTFSDITQLKAAELTIHSLAFYDPLTGLPNRRLLLNRLDQARAASKRSQRHGALLMVDVDRFKVVNDTLGHDIGDRLLAEVAARLRECIREGDTAARPGGDEFVVMLENLDLDEAAAAVQAEAVAEKVRAALNRPYALGDGCEHFSSASIGVNLFRGHDKATETLLKQADIALYKAKDAGRNAIRFFDSAMQIALEARTRLEHGLRQALARNEFRLHLQPQVDAHRRIIGAEALLRWQPPGAPLVAPADFIPVAEDSGLIVPIGNWVLDRACALLSRWQSRPATRDLMLAVNVSARQFRQPDFVDSVRASLADHGARPERLKLELTESLLLDNVDATISRMQDLRALGVRFSLDDFGTGYASLSYLKRFPFDQLKVDQSFVHDLESDPDDAAIVEAIIGMGRTLRLQVVAEGVEAEPQRDFLAGHGCSAFQGFLFGRPMPPEAFEERVLAERRRPRRQLLS